jgi:hypothetical protein
MIRARRGQADEAWEWFPRLIMFAVAVVVIVIMVRVYTERDVEAPELARAAYLYRIQYGDIIMYHDNETRRVYPGIVDMRKFTDERMDATFVKKEPSEDRSMIASQLVLTPMKGCAIPAKTIYNNRKTFELYAHINAQGQGGATQESDTYPVTARDGGTECGALLNITIVRPNS